MDNLTIPLQISALIVILHAQPAQVAQTKIVLLALFHFISRPHLNHAFLIVIQAFILPLLLPAYHLLVLIVTQAALLAQVLQVLIVYHALANCFITHLPTHVMLLVQQANMLINQTTLAQCAIPPALHALEEAIQIVSLVLFLNITNH